MGCFSSRAVPPPAGPRAGETDVTLHWFEGDFLRYAAIATLTFFEGDAAAAEPFLRARVAEVVLANPWLAGRLYWSQDGSRQRRLHLAYRSDGAAGAAAAFAVADAPPGLDEGSDATAVAAALAPWNVRRGEACVGVEPPLPLFLVTLLRGAGGAGRFALVVSLSHVIADGATYYELFNALSVGASTPVLRAERLDCLGTAADAVMGGPGSAMETARWGSSSTAVLRVLAILSLGPRPRLISSPVPPQWVAEQKAAALAAATAVAAGSVVVSTNDVVTSRLSRLGDYGVVLMALNLRGRAAGVNHALAGNYETVITYTREDAATPAGIRAAIASPSHLHRASDAPLPGWWRSLTTRVTLVTNWAGFFKELQLPGATLRRHVPVSDESSVRYNASDVFVIFAPRGGVVEVLAVTRNPRVTHASLAAAFAPTRQAA